MAPFHVPSRPETGGAKAVRAVTPARIAIAAKRLQNADAIAIACRRAGVSFFTACAIVEHETGGRNIYGHDSGGVNNIEGALPVTAENFFPFLVRVMNGETSNGVGPLQLTYAGDLKNGHRDGGHFRLMAAQGLCPWKPEDNLTYGLTDFKRLLDKHGGDIAKAGAEYNGGPNPNADARAYGAQLVVESEAWRKRLGV